MPRQALLVEIDPAELGSLSFLAGMLVGMGRPEAEVLQSMLNTAQFVEVDDDFTDDSSGGSASGPVGPSDSEEDLELDQPINVATDPTAPENMGIQLELPRPQEPEYQPFAEEGDFGAGPAPIGAD